MTLKCVSGTVGLAMRAEQRHEWTLKDSEFISLTPTRGRELRSSSDEIEHTADGGTPQRRL